MQFHNSGAEILVPDGVPENEALVRAAHVGIAAHPDDLEIMAYPGILECFGAKDRWFLGVVVTDGAGSPRGGPYAGYTDEEMREVRKAEQKRAAVAGRYAAQILLDYPSSVVNDPDCRDVVEDLKRVLEASGPSVAFTHNLADKHDTHVAVALRAIRAMRELPPEARPKAVYGCEVWRDLDWLLDRDKVVFDVSSGEKLAADLLSVFDSQISGGKRFDLAVLGRRRAHATFYSSHDADAAQALIFGMDLTPLVGDPSLDIGSYVEGHVRRFAQDVAARIARLVG